MSFINKIQAGAVSIRSLQHKGLGSWRGALWLLAMLLTPLVQAANIDLQVSSYDWTPDPVVNGGTATFTLTVQNNGPATSAASTLTIALPSNVNYVANTSGCTYSAPNLTCPITALALGSIATVNYTGTGNGTGVQVTAASIVENPVVNTDTNSDNNSLPKSVTSIKGADLSVTHTGPAGCTTCSATAGSVISFTITVSNNGPDAATTFRMTDNLPAIADFTYQSASGSDWSCSHGGTTLTCDYSGADVASAGSAPPITVTGRIITTAGSITNGASVVSTDSATADPVASNNGPVNRVVTVTAGTNLQANKSMVSSATGLTSMVNGEAVTLTLSATNSGTQQATVVTLTDTVPGDFSIGGPLPIACSSASQVITCTAATLNAGATTPSYVIPLTVIGNAGSSGINTANVSRSTPVGGANTPATSNYTIVAPFARLVITKSKAAENDVSPGDGDPVQTGQKILNTITVTNSASSTSAVTGTVTVIETLSSYPNETFDAVTGVSDTAGWACSASAGTVTCTFTVSGSLARNASLPDLVFTTHAVGSAMTLTNEACTSGNLSTHTPTDSNPTPACSGTKSIYSAPPNVDIGITKTVNDAAIAVTDLTFTYTIEVTNADGAATVPTVVVTDTMPVFYSGPAGTSPITPTLVGEGAGESCSVNGANGSVTCTIKNLVAGAANKRTINIHVQRPVKDGTYTNTASWDSPDAVQTVNNLPDTATATIVIDPIADVTVTTIDDAPDPVRVGTDLSYTTSIKNNGPSTADGVVLRHTIDTTKMDYVPGSAALTVGGSCSYVASFVGAPHAGSAGIECNTFSLSNNESRQLTFKLIPKYAYYNTANGHAPPEDYLSDASITTTTFESNAGNNTLQNTAHITADLIDLAVTKGEAMTYDPDGAGPLNNLRYDPVAFGDQIKYLVTLRNNGPSLATQLVATDTLTPPSGWTAAYQSAVVDGSSTYTPANLFCSVTSGVGTNGSPQVLTCYLSNGAGDIANSTLPAGKFTTLLLTFQTGGIDPPGSITYSNVATVRSAETGATPYSGDSLSGNNTVTETTTVLPKTDLYITKTASVGVDGDSSPYNINEVFNYVLTLGNKGTTAASGVRVTDALPSGFVAAGNVTVTAGGAVTLLTNSCNGTAWSGSCNLGLLPVDATGVDSTKQVVITIPVKAVYPYNGPIDTDILNTATIAPIDGTSIDPVASNNSGSVNVQVRKNSIAGFVYADNDSNNVMDPAAEGIGSVTLTLTGTDSYGYTYGSGMNYAALTTTTSGTAGVNKGSFLFDKLPPGTWKLVETQPSASGYWDRYETVGTAGGVKPADTCNGTDNCASAAAANTIGDISGVNAITLPVAVSTTATGYVFQEYRRAQLSGYVYSDLNNDGDRAASGEAGIASLSNHITLSGLAYNGVDVQTLITETVSLNASGQYSYTDLPPSDATGYTIHQNVQPTGYFDGKEQTGDLVANVVGASAGRQAFGTAGNNNTESNTGVVLAPNQAKTEHNFGELLPATLSGFVFIDTNGNAVRDAGDTSGVTGVTLTLNGTDDLGAVVGPTTGMSAANGAYSFTGLRPGTYSVTETAPAGMAHTGAQAGAKGGTINGIVRAASTGVTGAHTLIEAIPVAANDGATGYNFGETGQGLSGYVYVDLDRNGVKDGGEPGVADVQVTLSGLISSGVKSVCAEIDPSPCTFTTNAGGAYSFPNLPASNGTGYTLTEQSQAAAPLTNYADGVEQLGAGLGEPGTANNDNFSGIVLPLAGAGINYNFGEYGASLAGRVYYDANDDGSFAGADSGLSSVTVTLSGTTASGVNVCAIIASCTTSTAVDGTYSFTGLPASNGSGYTLTETQPTDYASRTTAAGSPAGSGATGTAISGIVLNTGVDGTGYLFGEKTNTLSGYVYVDADNDGVKDGGEAAIAGVTLTLSGNTASGVNVCTTIPSCITSTAADGSYSFAALRNAGAGGYTVTESHPVAYLDGRETVGTQNGVSKGTAANNVISAIAFDATYPAINVNFGEIQPASIAGSAYLDANDNGSQDAGDSGLAGLSISLTGTDDLAAVVNLNTTTAGDGSWSFATLRPGTYAVTETQPVDFLERSNTVGSAAGVAVTNAGVSSQFTGVVLASGTAASGYRFGEKGSAIAGYVYLDLDNDGIKDAGEIGISATTLTLSGTTLSGVNVCTLTTCTVTSSADGSYRFNALPNAGAGGYTVTETQPGYQDGKETAGSQGGTVDNSSFNSNAAQNRISAIPFNTASDSTGNNFGEIGNGRISGIVYWDVNSNNLRESGDLLLPSVTITLTGIDTNGGLIGPITQSTLINGTWSFTQLRPGTYTVTETQPVDYAEGYNQVGTGTGTSSVSGGNSKFSGIVIGGVDTADGYLFGEIANSLSGYVYIDLNNDGIKDAGETPLAGVSINLTGTTASSAAVYQTASTGTDGSYSFSNLKNGAYTVTETQPAAYLDGRETAGSQGGAVSNGSFSSNAAQNRISSIGFNAASASAGNNFGERATIDLSLNKTASTLTPSVGSNITFTVSVANAGPSSATGVVVADLLPAGYSFVSATPSQGNYVHTSGLWTIGTLTSGGSASLSVTAMVNASGSYANTAEVTGANEIDVDSTPGNHDGNEDDQKTETPAPTPVIDLSLNKTASNMTPKVGSTITFTVSVANAGPSSATGVQVTDQLPAGYTYVSHSTATGSYANTSGLWTLGSLAKDASANLTITATVNASGPYTNTAAVTAANETDKDSTPNNNSDSEDDQKTITPTSSAVIDLSLNKTASNMTPKVGSTITFTVSVANAGPSNATGVQVTDQLPAGYTYVSHSTATGGYVNTTGLWTLGSLAKDASANLTITATVNASGPYANTAEVTTANETDTDSTPNNHIGAEDDQKTVTPAPSAVIDLSLNKTASNMTPKVGSTITFTVSVANAGPSNATGVQVTDQLPAGYTYVSHSTATGGYVNTTGLWTLGSLAKDASANLTITATVNASGPYTNTAAVTAANETDKDSTPNNNSDSEDDQKTITPTSSAVIDLSLNKTASNMTPKVGSTITFTVSVANAGPSNATGVQVTDQLPAGYTYVSHSTATGGYVNTTGLWTLGSLAKDASANLTITATVNASGPYANTAEVTTANETDTDSTPNNHIGAEDDQKTVTPAPSAVIDLSLNKTASNMTPKVGSTITFTVSVANAGPSNATGVQVTDQLPAGYTYVSHSTATGGYVNTTGLWTLGSLAKDASANLTITATVNASGPYANTAEVTTANETDTDSTPNNHIGAEDDQKTVTPAPSAVIDLSLNKTASNMTPKVGSTITFTVSVANAGPSNATGVQVTDQLPAGYTYVSHSTATGGYVNTTGLWTLGSLAKDASANLTITATVNASGPYANTAEVTTANETDTDSTPNNHIGAEDDQKTVTPAPSAVIDLSLNKTASNMTPKVGSTITFTVSVANAGPSNATGVQVTDQLPAGYTYVSHSTATGGYVNTTGLWTLGSLAKDASANLTITATVNASGPYANTAEVTTANETDTDSTPNNHIGAEDDQKTVMPIPRAAISGKVYVDANNDGIAGAGETGLSVVSLTLSGYAFGPDGIDNGGAGDDIVVTDSKMTGAAGDYSFNELAPGTYRVIQLAQPVGTLNGRTTAGSVGGATTAVATTPSVISGIALSGVNSSGNNFGEVLAASLAGQVYDDQDGNGALDVGEPGLVGVDVSLTGFSDMGMAINWTTVTTAGGGWAFTGLRPGNYIVTESQPVDYAEGANLAGSAGGTAGLSGTNSEISGISLVSGINASGYLFGEKTGVISGHVYLDADNDGIWDVGETGISGVTLTLSGSTASGVAVNASAMTDSNGNYRFDQVKNAGVSGYSLSETQPGAYLDGRETAGSQGGTVDNASFSNNVAQNQISGIAFTAENSATEYNFAELLAASLTGKVWHDFAYGAKPLNSVQDGDEPGLAGVTITLTGTDDLGAAVSQTTTTGVDGHYRFEGLRPGTYQVDETQPTGVNDFAGVTGTLVGNIGGNVGGVASQNAISSIVIASGAQAVEYNFREDASVLVGGYVYLDRNGSHTRDAGDTGIAGVTLTLATANGRCADGGQTCTETSAADGGYLFAGLRSGTYSITETQPPIYKDADENVGLVAGVANGSADNTAYDATAQHNRITGITLGLGSQATGYHFGELDGVFATIAGTAWINTATSGSRTSFDPGDTALSGWRVELVHNGNVSASTITGADGTYRISTVTPDYNYSVRFVNPTNGQVWGSPVKNGTTTNPEGGTIEVNPVTGAIENITVPSAGAITGLDLPIDPSGVVYDSSSGVPVSGVTVTMSCPGLAATDMVGNSLTQVTDASGVYAFFVKPTAPAGNFTCSFAVDGPSGVYKPGTSSTIPACTSSLTILSTSAGGPEPALVQDNAAPPGAADRQAWNAGAAATCAANTGDGTFLIGATSARYYDTMVISTAAPASANLINNNIPIDPILGGAIRMTKTTPLINVSRGDLVPYTITAHNTQSLTLTGINLQDLMPPGFKYKPGSARFDDDCDGPSAATAIEPTINNRTLTWPNRSFATLSAIPDSTSECKRIKLMLVVGSGVGEGEYTNLTWALNGATLASNVATAVVRVVPEPTFDCSDIIGKVFDDQNANGYQDEGEPGIPNVRLATARGLLVTTDSEGRFHVACAVIPQAQRGSNFIMKLDERTLPSGYRITTENPREVRATRGKLVKLNFGAAIHRVVRVELTGSAFLAEKDEPAAALEKAIAKLPQTLRAKPSVIRLAYRKGGEAQGLIEARLRGVRERLEKLWKEQGCCYTLVFEEEIFERSAGKKRSAK